MVMLGRIELCWIAEVPSLARSMERAGSPNPQRPATVELHPN